MHITSRYSHYTVYYYPCLSVWSTLTSDMKTVSPLIRLVNNDFAKCRIGNLWSSWVIFDRLVLHQYLTTLMAVNVWVKRNRFTLWGISNDMALQRKVCRDRPQHTTEHKWYAWIHQASVSFLLEFDSFQCLQLDSLLLPPFNNRGFVTSTIALIPPPHLVGNMVTLTGIWGVAATFWHNLLIQNNFNYTR